MPKSFKPRVSVTNAAQKTSSSKQSGDCAQAEMLDTIARMRKKTLPRNRQLRDYALCASPRLTPEMSTSAISRVTGAMDMTAL